MAFLLQIGRKTQFLHLKKLSFWIENVGKLRIWKQKLSFYSLFPSFSVSRLVWSPPDGLKTAERNKILSSFWFFFFSITVSQKRPSVWQKLNFCWQDAEISGRIRSIFWKKRMKKKRGGICEKILGKRIFWGLFQNTQVRPLFKKKKPSSPSPIQFPFFQNLKKVPFYSTGPYVFSVIVLESKN